MTTPCGMLTAGNPLWDALTPALTTPCGMLAVALCPAHVALLAPWTTPCGMTRLP